LLLSSEICLSFDCRNALKSCKGGAKSNHPVPLDVACTLALKRMEITNIVLRERAALAGARPEP